MVDWGYVLKIGLICLVLYLFLILLFVGIYWLYWKFKVKKIKKSIPEKVIKEVQEQNADKQERIRQEAIGEQTANDDYSTIHETINLYKPSDYKPSSEKSIVRGAIIPKTTSQRQRQGDKQLVEQNRRNNEGNRANQWYKPIIPTPTEVRERERVSVDASSKLRTDKQKFKLHRPTDL